MKRLVVVSLTAVAISLAATAISSAQTEKSPPAGAVERPADRPDTTGSGTAPDGIGSTGWTGGSRSPSNINPGSQNSSKADPEAPQQQPPMATGADLQGPPKQFPAGETPE